MNVVLIKNVILMTWVNGVAKIVLVGMLTGLELDLPAMKIQIHVQKAILGTILGTSTILLALRGVDVQGHVRRWFCRVSFNLCLHTMPGELGTRADRAEIWYCLSLQCWVHGPGKLLHGV